MIELTAIFPLLFLFQLKHFLCDYPLQGKYMLGKFKSGWGWVLPLTAHVCVTSLGSLLVVSLFRPDLWWLCLVDFVCHFTMDRVKASPNMLGRFKDMMKPYFWWCLGFDQGFHHCTHYCLIYLILTL